MKMNPTSSKDVFKLKGFEIKRVKCTEKGCKKNIKPIKIKCHLELDPVNLDFRIVYGTSKAQEERELLGIKEFDLFNKPFPNSLRKDLLRKIINKLRHEDPDKLLCEGHIVLRKIRL